MKLYRTADGVVLERDGVAHPLPDPWDEVINREDLHDYLARVDAPAGPASTDSPGSPGSAASPASRLAALSPLAPIGSQEVWAAGVTYQRSRMARREESRDAGGGSFYDHVYEADRPELFFKAVGWRVRGPGQGIRVRRDAHWSVPEPELAAYVNARGEIIGYTIGNDVSSRDIEGENPLYLPQAKVYDGSCALGPALLVTPGPLPPDTTIGLRVTRADAVAFEAETTSGRMRRSPADLVAFLYRELTFPAGCVLLTGTGIVPPDHFTLRPDDVVTITIPPIGALVNRVET